MQRVTPRFRRDIESFGRQLDAGAPDAGSVEDGSVAEAVRVLELAALDDPLRERRWAMLMIALYRAGRRVEAETGRRAAAARLRAGGRARSGLDAARHRLC